MQDQEKTFISNKTFVAGLVFAGSMAGGYFTGEALRKKGISNHSLVFAGGLIAVTGSILAGKEAMRLDRVERSLRMHDREVSCKLILRKVLFTTVALVTLGFGSGLALSQLDVDGARDIYEKYRSTK